jgi:hypothetical protein
MGRVAVATIVTAVAFSLIVSSGVAWASASPVTTTGAITVLASPPSSVKLHGYVSTTTIPLLFESEQTLAAPLNVDTDSPGLVTASTSLVPTTVASGTCVDSFLLQLDTGGPSGALAGSVTFSQKILGVEVLDASLDASDFLGSPTTTYPSHPSNVERGIELSDNPLNGGNPDSFSLDSTLTDLTVNLHVETYYDQVRVIVACGGPGNPLPEVSSAIELPIAGVLVGGGFLAFAWRKRRVGAGPVTEQ